MGFPGLRGQGSTSPTQLPCLLGGPLPGIQPGDPHHPSHREGGPSSDQGVNEGGRGSAAGLGPGVRLGISAVVAEEALGVHREGVRELQTVREKDHDA